MAKIDIEKELTELKTKFAELMHMFEEFESNKAFISAQYSTLKQQVTNRAKELEKLNKDGELSEDEKLFLLPCIKKVGLCCIARVGATDIGELSSSIYDGEDYCSYWLTELQSS
ncbi:hypothetical protein L1D59_17870 [Pseudoalteromonas piscicida]|uniref:MbeD/MobD family mobilization/exclusion protein n=1 Tax=Pseudoalteromonas piscicida TaxID=43662 RepID=UPI001EFCBC4C|nr:MbeD/MobD family mobilization/exclusion protein [Pseudoalteromonas piscicida]MCG9770465.1 hypothetical protein [Pseudoalteromonas piscicida]